MLQYSEHGEGLQVLHYEIGQKYEPHYDYFMDEYNTRNGGQRIATVLMYLYVTENLWDFISCCYVLPLMLLSDCADQMLRRGVKQCFLQPRETIAQCHGGMSCLSAGKEGCL